MASTDHRKTAQELLRKATEHGYAPASPARLAILAEAQVHALLALSDTIEVEVKVEETIEETTKAAVEEAAVVEMAKAERAKARAPRAPRKPKAKPAPEADVVPGSEEDLIRRETEEAAK
ncbi:hypothetical protein SEA_EMOTION_58 [Arthrobacter phage Emotion]|uniref:Uncharacterized protein n=1 Tax=Arthrobacter phage Emotion TaxID=3038361 RepID=A0AA49ERY3_9CAUD|nr:hypothetical protein SEA_EMOTION_58 [Arthrobacter phage Emotion]